MRAHLVLKNASAYPRDEAILPTAATVKDLLATSETVQKAEKAAKQLGFKVVSVSPLQVTIEGRKQQFEKAFSSRLKPANAGRKAATGSHSTAKKSLKKRNTSPETPVNSELWAWETPPELPAEIEDVVQEIVLPQAVALH